jgi:hypothetical protein
MNGYLTKQRGGIGKRHWVTLQTAVFCPRGSLQPKLKGFLNAFAVQSLPRFLPTGTIRWIGPFREFIGLSILNRSPDFRARDTLI